MIDYVDGWYVVSLRVPEAPYLAALVVVLASIIAIRVIRWLIKLIP